MLFVRADDDAAMTAKAWDERSRCADECDLTRPTVLPVYVIHIIALTMLLDSDYFSKLLTKLPVRVLQCVHHYFVFASTEETEASMTTRDINSTFVGFAGMPDNHLFLKSSQRRPLFVWGLVPHFSSKSSKGSIKGTNREIELIHTKQKFACA